MTGKVIISNNGGWSCSNVAKLDFHDLPVRDVHGKMTGLKRSHTLVVDNLYDVATGFDRGQEVEAAIMMDKGEKRYLSGVFDSETRTELKIKISAIGGEDIAKQLITKIKTGGN